jgi:hypothetical protein
MTGRTMLSEIIHVRPVYTLFIDESLLLDSFPLLSIHYDQIVIHLRSGVSTSRHRYSLPISTHPRFPITSPSTNAVPLYDS